MARTMIKELSSLEGNEVEIAGWVDTIREHGKLIFLEIRDVTGSVQTIVTAKDEKNFEIAKSLTKESCIKIKGNVSSRPTGTENKNSPAGNVEVKIQELEIYNKCSALPFDIDNDEVGEDIRLKYRYLDLRRPEMQKNLILRSKVVRIIRDALYEEGFNEFETPMLAKSTPEGARDYIVPSRTQPGKFFALPQSPQLFKQLLMVAGFEKYFQIARCMRDEDLRSDRQPEFTQLDIEMSFVSQEDVMALTEKIIKKIWKEILNVEVKTPFQKITHDEAMKKYKTDRPDLRKDKNDSKEFAFCWVVDFPLFEYSKEENKTVAIHHPFTHPEMESFNKDPKTAKSIAYDTVLNGVEICGGSIRIHEEDIQAKVFEVLGIGKKEQKEKFGFLLDALKFGAPPHGGIAWGLDRLIQVILGVESIRETIAFPKNKEAKDLMVDAPSPLSDRQLKDVHIKLDIGKKGK
ncbi:aspartate--tRNA ligase [Candidatus Pacearchaeota archaeon]|nr:aspartate--tRNA ligase [Candidatus Pacearchaeota archaeon]